MHEPWGVIQLTEDQEVITNFSGDRDFERYVDRLITMIKLSKIKQKKVHVFIRNYYYITLSFQ